MPDELTIGQVLDRIDAMENRASAERSSLADRYSESMDKLAVAFSQEMNRLVNRLTWFGMLMLAGILALAGVTVSVQPDGSFSAAPAEVSSE